MSLKTLNHPTFYSRFDRIARADDPQNAQRRWVAHGLEWARTRHSAYGPDYSFTTDVTVVRRGGAKSFGLMVVREGWWSEARTDPIKTRQWAHILSGQRAHVLGFFAALFDELTPELF
jgi:hypothetical protein